MKLLILAAVSLSFIAYQASAKHLYLQAVKDVSLKVLRSYVPLASRARWARGSLGVREYVNYDPQIKRPDLAYQRLERGMIYLHARSLSYFAALLGLTEERLQTYVELEKVIDKFARLSPNELGMLTRARREAFAAALQQQQYAKQWAVKSPRAGLFFKSLLRIEVSDLDSYDHPSSAVIINGISSRYDDVSKALGRSWLEEHEQRQSIPALLPPVLASVKDFEQQFAAKINGFKLSQIADKDLVIYNFSHLQVHEPEAVKPVLQEYLAAKNDHDTDWRHLRQRLEQLAKFVTKKPAPINKENKELVKAIADLAEHVGTANVIATLTSNLPPVATLMRTARGDQKLSTFASENLTYSYLSRIESGKRLASAKVLPFISSAYGIDLYELRQSMLVERIIQVFDYFGGSSSASAAEFGAELLNALETAKVNLEARLATAQTVQGKTFDKTFANHNVSQFERSYSEDLVKDMQDKGYSIAKLSELTGIDQALLKRFIARDTYAYAKKKQLRKIAEVMEYDYDETLVAMEMEKLIGRYRHLRFVVKDYLPSVDHDNFVAALAKYQASKFSSYLYAHGITLADINAFTGVAKELIQASGKDRALNHSYRGSLINYNAYASSKTIAATADNLELEQATVQRIIAVADAILTYSKSMGSIAKYLPTELNTVFTAAIERTNIKAPSNTLGTLIQEAREQQNLSTDELARLASNASMPINRVLKSLHTTESSGADLPYELFPFVADALHINVSNLQEARRKDGLLNYSTYLKALLNYYEVTRDELDNFILPRKLRTQGKPVIARAEELNKIIIVYRMIVDTYGSQPKNINAELNAALAQFLE